MLLNDTDLAGIKTVMLWGGWSDGNPQVIPETYEREASCHPFTLLALTGSLTNSEA